MFGLGGHNGDVFCYRSLVQHLEDHRRRLAVGDAEITEHLPEPAGPVRVVRLDGESDSTGLERAGVESSGHVDRRRVGPARLQR